MPSPRRSGGAGLENLSSLGTKWQDFWRPPDPLLQDEGGVGELTVAQLRLVVTGVMSAVTGAAFLADRSSIMIQAGFATATGALVLSLAVYALVKHGAVGTWIGFATGALDVTMVSGALVVFLLIGEPHIAVNSRILFAAYFIVIAATTLRYDPRICTTVGLLALLQYAAIVAFADTRWMLNSWRYAPFEHGMFSLNAHYGRLLLLGFAVLLSTIAVLRAQTLRWLSAKDPLTGLMNRGFFDERMQSEVVRADRYGRSLSVAMIDIDHFKLFNDTYGHVIGDDVLRTVAATIQKSVRKSDLVARYGGEDFVVVFPETDAADAVVKANELRQAIQSATVHLPRVPATSGVTVSTGISSLPTDGIVMRDALDRADQRLYEAKQAGRNRVVGPPEFANLTPATLTRSPTDERD